MEQKQVMSRGHYRRYPRSTTEPTRRQMSSAVTWRLHVQPTGAIKSTSASIIVQKQTAQRGR